jgi:hypothetical protein
MCIAITVQAKRRRYDFAKCLFPGNPLKTRQFVGSVRDLGDPAEVSLVTGFTVSLMVHFRLRWFGLLEQVVDFTPGLDI